MSEEAIDWSQFETVDQPTDWSQFEVVPSKEAAPSKAEGSYAVETAKNILPSAGNLIKNIASTVVHPIDTTVGLGNAIWGAAEKAMPDSWVKAIPGNEQHQQAANAIGEFYANRYGSVEKAAEAFKTDPVGVLSDLSMALGAAGKLAKTGAVARAAQGMDAAGNAVANTIAQTINPTAQVSKVAPAQALAKAAPSVLDRASELTNPMNAIAPIVNKTADIAGVVPKVAAALETGTSMEAVDEAIRSGQLGKKDFLQNMRRQVPFENVVDQARAGVQVMKNAMKDQYTSARGAIPGKTGWADDTTHLPNAMPEIQKAYADLVASMKTASGRVKIDPAEMSVVQRIGDAINDWANAPAHTVEELDGLKQRIANLKPDNVLHSQARRAASTMANKVKQIIVDQAPQYKQAMNDYWQQSSKIEEIEKGLSLGEKSSVDTALRKLHSVLNNNVNTNFGARQKYADIIKNETGIDLMPALAGQVMSSKLPRGLARIFGGAEAGAATLATILGNPLAGLGIGANLLMSMPRVAGEGFYKVGQAKGALNRLTPSREAMNIAGSGGLDQLREGR